MTALLARWTEKLAGGPQAEPSDFLHLQGSWEWVDNNKMSDFPATVGGLSADIPVGTVQRALAIAEHPGSGTVSITISLELLVDLTQTVAGLVGQQLYEAVGQEKMSSDVEPGDESGTWGRLLRRHSL